MPEPEERERARSSRRRLDLVYGAHLALVGVLGIGWCLRAVELAGAAGERSFAASTGGRAVAWIAMVAGISAIVAVLYGTAREHKDAKSLLLLVLLGCAFASRRGPDAFDVLYVVAALGLSAHWFSRGRRLLSGPGSRPGAAGGGPERRSV